MHSHIKTIRQVVFATTLATGIGTAVAQPAETADAALRRGQAALKAGRVPEACQAFEVSDRVEPNLDTKFALASCYEQDGKLATAARLYLRIAEDDQRPARRKEAADKADKLQTKAPRLRFAINPRPEGLSIEVDGAKVATTGDVRVDLGPHTVVATAPGFEGKASVAIDRPGKIVDVIIRMQPKQDAAPPPAPAPVAPAPAPVAPIPQPAITPPPASPVETQPAPMAASTAETSEGGGNHRRRNGFLVGGAGLGLAVGSAVLMGLAASKFSDESDLCPNATCANSLDLKRADALLSNGKTMRGIGIGLGAGGVALIAVGTYLLATSGGHADHVSVQMTRDSGGLAYTGQF